jgi:predicted Zn-dependent protease
MNHRLLLLACLAALAVSGLLVQAGRVDANQSLESVARLWGDVTWDTNRAATRLVHVSPEAEIQLGDRIYAAMAIPEDKTDAAYVDSVGQSLLSTLSRPGIRYVFHIVQDPAVNAFAIPGGHVYVTTGLMNFVQSEAELAAVLGHEIAHIDLQHCLDVYRYEAALGGNEIAELADHIRQAPSRAYSQQQEFDADSRGVLFALSASYDPTAAARVFRRLALLEPAANSSGLLGPYLQSHPTSAGRASRLDAIIARESAKLAGKPFYIGVKNLQDRTSLTHRVINAEWTTSPAN